MGIIKFSQTFSSGASHHYQLKIDESNGYFANYPNVHSNGEVFYLKPKAWIRIHIKDLNPDDGLENLIVKSNSFSYNSINVSGNDIDTEKLIVAHPKDSAELRCLSSGVQGERRRSIAIAAESERWARSWRRWCRFENRLVGLSNSGTLREADEPAEQRTAVGRAKKRRRRSAVL